MSASPISSAPRSAPPDCGWRSWRRLRPDGRSSSRAPRLAAIAEQLRLAEAADAETGNVEPADAGAPTSVEQDHIDEPVAAVTPLVDSVAAAAEQDAIDEPVAAVTPLVESVTAAGARQWRRPVDVNEAARIAAHLEPDDVPASRPPRSDPSSCGCRD